MGAEREEENSLGTARRDPTPSWPGKVHGEDALHDRKGAFIVVNLLHEHEWTNCSKGKRR